MKKVTKILSVVLVLALVMTMSVVLFACGDESNNTPQLDNVDLKVNSTLDTYFNNYLPARLNVRSVDAEVGMKYDSFYWDDWSIVLYKKYVNPNYKVLNNKTFLEDIVAYEPADITVCSKQYWALKANDLDTKTCEAKFREFLDVATFKFDDFGSPLILSVAMNLGMNDEAKQIIDKKIADFNASKELDASNKLVTEGAYGSTDAMFWVNSLIANYYSFTAEDVKAFSDKVVYEDPAMYQTMVSNVIPVLFYSACGLNIRDLQAAAEKDAIELIVEKIDASTNLILLNPNGQISTDFSLNQLYASLLVYQLQRDNGGKINVFALA